MSPLPAPARRPPPCTEVLLPVHYLPASEPDLFEDAIARLHRRGETILTVTSNGDQYVIVTSLPDRVEAR